MNKTFFTTQRNQSIEICKLIASLFIIFLHSPLPGSLGNIMDCFSRFAVPFFFAVSGYFNFNTDAKTVFRRIKHIVKLSLYAFLFYLLWYSVRSISYGGTIPVLFNSIFTIDKLLNWLILNLHPLSDHLWYLSAILYCYFIFWIYTYFFRKRTSNTSLYLLGFALLSGMLLLDGPISTYIMYIPHYIYRNAWFMGLSAFILGIFLCEYRTRIINLLHLTNRKLVFLIIFGSLLSLLQNRIVGMAEISLGAIITASALILFCLMNPEIPISASIVKQFISRSGTYSTTVYIIHLAVIDFYCTHFQSKFSDLLGTIEAYLRPVFIFIISLLIAVILDNRKRAQKSN